VRMYDRLFAVPFPGARLPWGAPAEGAVAIPVVATPEAGHSVAVAGDDDEAPEVAERNYLDDLNPDSKRVITARVEPAVLAAQAGETFQFERHGYFVADLKDHAAGRPVFNRTVTLRDSRDRRSGP